MKIAAALMGNRHRPRHALPLLRRRGWACDALWGWRGQRRLCLVRDGGDPRQAGVAGLVPSQGDDPAQTRPSPSTHRAAKWHRRAWWPCKSARRARHVSLARQQGHAVSDPRHQRALDNWHERLVRLHPHDQSGCDRPVRADCYRDECCRAIKRLSPHRMIWPEARPMCPELELIRALSEDLALETDVLGVDSGVRRKAVHDALAVILGCREDLASRAPLFIEE